MLQLYDRLGRARAIVTCAVLLVTLTGCVSPYVARPRPDYSQTYPRTTLSAALAHAHDTRDAYRAKIIALGESERALSNSLITLGGAILAAGAFGAHRDTLIGGALLGGTAYGLGVFNTDKRRAVIYVAGMKALDCAADAVSPLNFDDATASALRKTADDLDGQIAEVARSIAAVERLIQAIEAKTGRQVDITQAARQDVLAARQSLAKADAARGSADQLLLKRATAGGQLMSAVGKIDTAVLDEIRGTEGALQAVPDVIAGLVKSSQVFAPTLKLADILTPGQKLGPHSLPPEDREMPQLEAQLAAAVTALKGATAVLDGRSERLVSFVQEVNKSKPIETLKTCKVEGLDTAMTVEPAELAFTAKRAEKKSIVIKGGKKPYKAAFLQDPTPGLSIESPLLGEDVIVVAASDQTVANTYRMMVWDATRDKTQTIAIKVTDDSNKGKDPGKADAPTANSLAAKIKGTTLNVKGVDVSFPEVTKRGDGKLDITYSLPKDATVSEVDIRDAVDKQFQISNVLGMDKIVLGRGADIAPHSLSGKRSLAQKSLKWGPVAAGLSREQIRLLQSNLCLRDRAVDGVWGNTTQAALYADRDWRRERRGMREVPGGPLTAAEADTLLRRSSTETADRCSR